MYSLGIDTSNYKTSVAITDSSGNILSDERKLLDVKKGARGLRQQEAVFQHVHNLPVLLDRAFNDIDKNQIECIAVSSRPRDVEGSYMPVFSVGASFANVIATALSVPCFDFSHQEGHIEAVRRNSTIEKDERYAAFHLSGGTSEVLISAKNKLSLIGTSQDISFGQVIDRLGVYIGYPFPSGAMIDKQLFQLFLDGTYGEVNSLKKFASLIPKIKHTDYKFNLSGIETAALKKIGAVNSDEDVNRVFLSVFFRFSELLCSIMKDIYVQYGISKFLFTGGVSESKTIRNIISKMALDDCDIVFAESGLSSDNAIGISYLGGDSLWL